jgi:hypothetical protein
MSGVTELRVGRARLLNLDINEHLILDADVRKRVRALAGMYRERGRDSSKGSAISDIGIVSIGENDFRPFIDREFQEVQELRHVLFLCCLSSNARLGHNGTHMMVTAENFDVIRQNFVLDSDYMSEQTGTLIQMHLMGYRIRETRFTRPSYVNRPTRFKYDEKLCTELKLLRSNNRRLYRRITRAAAVFLESYYNSPRVDIRARVLLQVAAFEILLDLPEQQPRKAFKESIESLLKDDADRKYRYKFQAGNRTLAETRTLAAIWADRFYTLRNHIAHGETIPRREYVFRREQHHLIIAPLMFVACLKRQLEMELATVAKHQPFYEKVSWQQIRGGDQYEKRLYGFRIVDDFARKFDGKNWAELNQQGAEK